MPTNNARGGRRRIPQTAAQMHKDWLQLVMAEGPFLAVPRCSSIEGGLASGHAHPREPS